MPTYDYQCTTCGKRFDVTQSIKADTLAHCPEAVCEQSEKGKGLVVRVISGGAGVIYTGEGFYLTDYVRKPEGSKEGSSKEGSKEGSSKEERSGSPAGAGGSSTTEGPSKAPLPIPGGSSSSEGSSKLSAIPQRKDSPAGAGSSTPSSDK